MNFKNIYRKSKKGRPFIVEGGGTRIYQSSMKLETTVYAWVAYNISSDTDDVNDKVTESRKETNT